MSFSPENEVSNQKEAEDENPDELTPEEELIYEGIEKKKGEMRRRRREAKHPFNKEFDVKLTDEEQRVLKKIWGIIERERGEHEETEVDKSPAEKEFDNYLKDPMKYTLKQKLAEVKKNKSTDNE